MQNYYIESFNITNLWGYRNIDLSFNRDVNILIGPNGSGKTTVLNLIHSILSAELSSIVDNKFEYAEIKLRRFKGKAVRTIKVYIEKELLTLKVGNKLHRFDINILSRRRSSQVFLFDDESRYIRHRLPMEIHEIMDLVPLVWLPVSRRLPVIEDEEERRIRRESIESVDLRLKKLRQELIHYNNGLNAQLSDQYRQFERDVLSVILFSKEQDQVDLLLKAVTSSLPTETEKDQLLRAFDDAGLLDEQMQSRINDHFTAVEESIKRIKRIKQNTETEEDIYQSDDILVLPLISRTEEMVEFARKLEEYRKDIFAPLQFYENTVNSFLEDKTIKVDESDALRIESDSKSELSWRDLSSGEKQILILFTEALLRENEPVVYIADEPELSLHVTWQEKLLESLVTIGGEKQIIVATHSPDIVGKYRDNVIILGKRS